MLLEHLSTHGLILLFPTFTLLDLALERIVLNILHRSRPSAILSHSPHLSWYSLFSSSEGFATISSEDSLNPTARWKASPSRLAKGGISIHNTATILSAHVYGGYLKGLPSRLRLNHSTGMRRNITMCQHILQARSLKPRPRHIW